jgi:type III secretion system FlhB-like substrate exporter
MNNSIIGKVGKSKYFNYKPLPLPGEYMPIPSSLPGFLFLAEIQYQFNQLEYKTPPNFVAKIRKSCVVVVSKNEFSIGLRYDEKEMNAPIIMFKEKCSKNIMQLCNENNTPIKYNKPLARYLYHDGTLGDEIPEDAYKAVADILAKLSTAKVDQFAPHDAAAKRCRSKKET